MRPMLASPAKDIKFPVYASPKIDGIRAYTNNGLYSRSGKLIPNKYAQDLLRISAVNGLDGELCVGPPNYPNLMQVTTSGMMTAEGRPNFTYWVFDIWSKPTMPFEQRLRTLNREAVINYEWVLRLIDAKIIQFLPQELIHNMDELTQYETDHLAIGYEGIMIRDPNSPYKYGRSTAREGYLLKVKRWEDSEAIILDFKEFMHNANPLERGNFGEAKRSHHQENKVPMDTLGSLVCQDVKTAQLVDIGTGFDQITRKLIWDAREAFKGKIVKYKHFAQAGVKDAPRFPVFIGFRDERDMS